METPRTNHEAGRLPGALNVLQVIPEMETGGAEQTTLDVAAGIIAAGGVAVVATRGGRLVPRLEEIGAKVHLLPVHSKNPLTIAANITRLKRLIRTYNINIVHARSRAPAWSALAAARATGAAFVTTYHGSYNAKSNLKRFYNSGMARGDQVIANSAFIAARIKSEHPGLARNMTIIPRGTDLDRYSPGAITEERLAKLREDWGVEANKGPIILLPGRLTPWKGQTVLIDAAARLRASGFDNFLIILAGDPQGRDDYVKALWEQIHGAHLDTQVKMVGHCADIPAACALSTVVVSASTDPEAFGRIAVEAQALERPIIASDHGGAEETVVDEDPHRTGWRVPPGDAEALAEALRTVLTLPPEDRARIGRNGRENARNFSVEAMVDATLAVYRKALHKD